MTESRIPIAAPVLGEEELANVVEAVRSGWISSRGAFIGEFEREFAAFCGTRHGIAVANGTMALHIALLAAGVGPGDEVLVPSLTFIATANVVRYCSAVPVFVDSDRAPPSRAAPTLSPPVPRAIRRAIRMRRFRRR